MSDLFPTIGSIANQTNDIPNETPNTESTTENNEQLTQSIDSLCMKCGEQGVTRLLLTSIPYFREVIVMSFRCEHCGTQNNEIQSAGTIRPEGTVYTTRILARSDLNRQIVRSPTCTIIIPEQKLTIPATTTSRGQLTTVEGLVRDIVADLSMDQPLRRIQDEDGYNKIEALIGELKKVLGDPEDEDGEEHVGKAAEKDLPMPPFTVKLDDPAGNSFIEFIGSMADPKWNMRTYKRTRQQNVDLGLIAAEEGDAPLPTSEALTSVPEDEEVKEIVVGEYEKNVAAGEQVLTGGGAEGLNEEIFVFPGRCPSCGHAINTLMKKVSIPYFKDILIMSTNCDLCGYRDNEVKSGSAISEKGKRITLKVEDREDLSRDILKSETSGLTIPEIDLILQHGTLGGRFTTLEGILEQVYEELSEKTFASGDASTKEEENTFETFLKNLKAVKNAERPFTLIIDDPLANSYVQNLYAPDPDPNMTVESYERTWEQNEELGLNDMKVEGYGESDEEKETEEKEQPTEGKEGASADAAVAAPPEIAST